MFPWSLLLCDNFTTRASPWQNIHHAILLVIVDIFGHFFITFHFSAWKNQTRYPKNVKKNREEGKREIKIKKRNREKGHKKTNQKATISNQLDNWKDNSTI